MFSRVELFLKLLMKHIFSGIDQLVIRWFDIGVEKDEFLFMSVDGQLFETHNALTNFIEEIYLVESEVVVDRICLERTKISR